MALPIVSLALLSGCGSSGDTTAAATVSKASLQRAFKERASAQMSPSEEKILASLKRQLGSESWYPLVVQIGRSEKSVVVGTALTDHKTAARNRARAEAMCNALLTAPGITSANVLYDDSAGGSTASCSDEP